ncbi:hypothetical protein [Vagococcus carniphilus]|uniref:hypothetical protein n=1 Tax=Vagococcus carniphilus TaxID=218144 RepID=UPI00289277F3|nr:hypothetical protein [Vagococcus carniphilus]MDT2863757.1 hypothetical protein [Vagococcus carniphilus]
MKKKWVLLLLIPLLVLVGCGNKEKKQEVTNSSEKGMVIKDEGKKRSDIINNILVGKSKISFNNAPYDKMSDGKFTQSELWGTFQNKSDNKTSIQINAADSLQKIYGDINGYELKGVKWDVEDPVQYLGVMEEALQYSKDKKALMYKARTGDIIFSVTMFSKNKLTDKNELELKRLAKGIKVEYVEGQIGVN